MKQTFLFIAFLFTLTVFGQKDKPDTNISVISVEKANILYRGVANPLKIVVPGAKSFTITGPGELTKMDSLGNYRYNVNGVSGKRTKIFIDAIMQDNTIKHEEKEFEIWEINRARAYVDGTKKGTHRPYEMTHKELANLKLKITRDDLYFTIDSAYSKPSSFSIDIEGGESIRIKGDRMTPKAYKFIKQLPAGTILYITDIYQYNPSNASIAPVQIIKIIITEENKIEASSLILRTYYRNNTLYRGIENELHIEVPDSGGFKIKAQGLRTEQDSTFFLNVTNIKQDTLSLDFEVITNNDSVFHHKEFFNIKDITPKKVTINNKSCSGCILEMTLQELKDAIVDIQVDNTEETEVYFQILSFIIKLPDGKEIEVDDDKITDEVITKLSKLPKKTVFEIKVPGYLFDGLTEDPKPLKIKLVSKH